MLIIYVQYIFGALWFVCSVLALQDHSATLQNLNAVPLPDWDVQCNAVAIGCQINHFCNFSGIIVVHFAKVTAQAHYRLGGFCMAMDGQRRTRLEGV